MKGFHHLITRNQSNLECALDDKQVDKCLQYADAILLFLESRNRKKDGISEENKQTEVHKAKQLVYAVLFFLSMLNNEVKHNLENRILNVIEKIGQYPSQITAEAVDRVMAELARVVPIKFIPNNPNFIDDFKKKLLEHHELVIPKDLFRSNLDDPIHGGITFLNDVLDKTVRNNDCLEDWCSDIQSNNQEATINVQKLNIFYQYSFKACKKGLENLIKEGIIDSKIDVQPVEIKTTEIPQMESVFSRKADKCDFRDGLWPCLNSIRISRSQIVDRTPGLAGIVKDFSSTEEYTLLNPDSPENSHVVLMGQPKSSEELVSILKMNQVRKLIVHCEESQIKKFEHLAREYGDRIVFLRQWPLVTISYLLNLSKLIKSAADIYQENDQNDLALARYQMSLDLQLNASEVLQDFRRNNTEN